MTEGFFHCSVKAVGRAKGRSVVAAAAYRAGIRIEDERTGQIADYRARGGVAETFVLARGDDATARAQDIGRLWNDGERAEPRANGRIATEIVLGLPHELDAATRKQLLTDYLAPIIEQYGVAAQVSIHAPDEKGDHRNWHAHVLVTHREYGRDGFGEVSNPREIVKKRGPEMIYGIAANPTDIVALRQQWEQQVNRAYERAGLDIRVDHRSHKDRGIEQEPTKHLGPVATEMERKEPGSSDRGDANREIEERNRNRRLEKILEGEIVKLEAALAEAEQRKAAIGRYDDIRPDTPSSMTEPEPARAFGTAEARVTGPGIFDRDQADAAWMKAVEAAAIAKAERGTGTARKAAEMKEHGRATDAPEQSTPPATEPPRAPQPDLAAHLDRMAEADVRTEIRQTVREAERATSRSFADAGKAIGKALGFVWRISKALDTVGNSILGMFDFFAGPTAPPTREEAEGKQRTAEEQHRKTDAQQSYDAQEARLQDLLDQIRRNDQQSRLARERDEERDDDRGREREL